MVQPILYLPGRPRIEVKRPYRALRKLDVDSLKTRLGCIYARWRLLASPVFGVALLIVSFGTMTFAPMGGFDGPRFWASILCFTLALPGLFLATKDIRWMNRLGDLSYTVYLVHGIVIAVAGEMLAEALPLASPYVSASAVLALVFAAAVIVHWTIEKPVALAMRQAAGYFTRSATLRSLGAALKR